jgi:hypothetical protein
MTTKFATVSADTDQGLRLPVVDVTHPAFAVNVDDTSLDALAEQFVSESRDRPELPAPLRAILAQSRLGGALTAAAGTFLPGLPTYWLKIGPEQLPDPFTDIDRRIAASFPAFATRIRLQDMAQLLADGSSVRLAAAADRALHFINIAGGPAADSWNALIRLRGEAPALLNGRVITIAVLDLDESGPRFGARAVAALTAADGPLAGASIEFRHLAYDWSEPERLGQLLSSLGGAAADPVCAISSEGGLFEYGDDETIVANLARLHAATPRDAFIVGSVTREGEPARASLAASRVPTRPRTLEAFGRLAQNGGWTIDMSIARPFTYDVRLTRLA